MVRKFLARLHSAETFCLRSGMYLLNVYSIFKVREVFALTNQLGNFFDLNEPNLDFFKKIFPTAFQEQKSPYHITRM